MDDSKPRILFVDDDPNLLAGLRRALRSYQKNWQMSFLASAELALHSHTSYPFQVVVTDMLMSGMGGLELVQKLNVSRSPPVCIVLTGMSDLHEASRLINTSKVFRFYTKPCPREELIDGISAALKEQQGVAVVTASSAAPAATLLERDILDSLSRGVMVLDANCRPVYMNQPATALVAQRRGLMIDNSGVLRAGNRADTQRLHSMLDALTAPDETLPGMNALPLSVEGQGAPLMLVMMPASLTDTGESPYAVVFLSGAGCVGGSAPSPEMIATVLGISYTEARLLERLVQGVNLEGAAEDMGVTLSSARTYLKRMQKKTGAHRQLDLIRMVLDIPLP